jgi:hypothetical protein
LKVAVLGRRKVFWLCAFVILLVGASGCQQTTPPGADMVSAKIGDTSYTFLHWKEGLRVMMWFDMADEVSAEGSGSTSDPIHKMEGYASATDGRRVDWRLETADGRTATFSIDGQAYDLSQGALFLITTRGGTTQVRQLNRDLSAVQATNESCEAFATADPDVSSFIYSVEESQ